MVTAVIPDKGNTIRSPQSNTAAIQFQQKLDAETARETRRAGPNAANNRTVPRSTDPETDRETRRASAAAPNNQITPQNIKASISRLNSSGDQAVFNVQVEGAVVVNRWKYAGAGGQVKLSREISVTQEGDGNTAKYVVAYNKNTYGGVVGRLSAGPAQADGEFGLAKTDTVTMTFNSKEDAAKAVERLQRAAVIDAGKDALKTSAAGRVVAKFIPDPVKSDKFLSSNITSYSTTYRNDAAVVVAAELSVHQNINLGVEAESGRAFSLTREVKVDADGNPTSLTYSASAGIKADYKNNTSNSFSPTQKKIFSELGVGAQDIQDVGSASVTSSVTWKLSKDEAHGVRVIGPAEVAVLAHPRAPDQTALSLETNVTAERYSTNRTDMNRETWSKTKNADGVKTEHKKEFVRRDGQATEYNASVGKKSPLAKKGIDIEFAVTVEGGLNDTTVLVEDEAWPKIPLHGA